MYSGRRGGWTVEKLAWGLFCTGCWFFFFFFLLLQIADCRWFFNVLAKLVLLFRYAVPFCSPEKYEKEQSKDVEVIWYEWAVVIGQPDLELRPKPKYYLNPSFEGGEKEWSKSRSSLRRFVNNTRCGRGEKVTLELENFFVKSKII